MKICNPIMGAIFSAMVFAPGAQAADATAANGGIPGEFSGNVGLFSEYYFRGISQTDDAPALQGGFDWSVDLDKKSGTGAYLGLWGSNVDFNEAAGVDGATLEVDVYGGLTGAMGNSGIGWDVGFIYYAYPGADSSLNYDFWEGQVAVSYDFGMATATASLNASPDYFGSSGAAYYPKFALDVPVGKHVTLSGHVAKQYIENNTAFGQPDYVDWSLGATVNVVGFDVNLTWSDTDLSESQCSDACGMFLLSVSRSF